MLLQILMFCTVDVYNWEVKIRMSGEIDEPGGHDRWNIAMLA